MQSLKEEKKCQRSEIRKRIAAMDEIELEKSDNAIYNNLSSLAELCGAKRVFLYASAGREISTEKLIASLYAQGKTVCLPVSLANGEMFFAEYRPETLCEGRFKGILEPSPNAAPVEPAEGDIILVPALCFNRQGYRMGQGGGYYDRYLSRHKLYSVGLAREALLCDGLQTEPHDIRVDCVVTETEIIKTGVPEGTP